MIIRLNLIVLDEGQANIVELGNWKLSRNSFRLMYVVAEFFLELLAGKASASYLVLEAPFWQISSFLCRKILEKLPMRSYSMLKF